MPPLSPTLNRWDLRALKKTNNDTDGQGLLKKDWNWNWDYSDLYEANGESDNGQKNTIGLSTESPFYFMEFYSQDRINEGSKRPPASPQPDYASQRPNTFDYLDHGLANTATTTRPSPIFLPEPPKIFQQSTDQEAIQQPASTQTQQRTFLLTTLLPICIIIVILLA
ncbi:unnamed protein product, partial [Hymenolepis diminuta]